MGDAAPSSPAPGWRLDEVASAGRENLDGDHVARYDLKEDAGAAAEVALLRDLGLDADTHLVDMGAGTGQLSLAAAAVCARVVAVDVSPVMLQRLRAKVVVAQVTNVEVVQSGFLSYEHRGRAADFVYSRYALHHLPDFWKAVALQRIRGVLRRGGVFRLSDVVYRFEPSEAEQRVEAWCATVPTSNIEGEWIRSELEEHVRDEHTTFTWLLEPMLARTGFAVEDAQYSPDGIFATYVARAV